MLRKEGMSTKESKRREKQLSRRIQILKEKGKTKEDKGKEAKKKPTHSLDANALWIEILRKEGKRTKERKGRGKQRTLDANADKEGKRTKERKRRGK